MKRNPDVLRKCPLGYRRDNYEEECYLLYGEGNGLLCPHCKHDPNKVLQKKCFFKLTKEDV